MSIVGSVNMNFQVNISGFWVVLMLALRTSDYGLLHPDPTQGDFVPCVAEQSECIWRFP